MDKVRGKFAVISVACVNWSPTVRIIKLSPVCDTTTPENERFTRYTPSGSIEMTVDNPPASDFLVLGKTFYVDFIPVDLAPIA
jgi:hypothetical protein